MLSSLLWLLCPYLLVSSAQTLPRFDCHPESDASQSSCETRGCLWNASCPSAYPANCPPCFYPDDYGYTVYAEANQSQTAFSKAYTAFIQRSNKYPPVYGNDIERVSVQIEYQTANRLHLKFLDSNTSNVRYEVPISLNTAPSPQAVNSTNYGVQFTQNIGDMFGIKVYRKSNGETLFDTSMPGFVYSSQFLQINMLLPNHSLIYGFGERFSDLQIPLNYTTASSFARDVHNWYTFKNSYGVHPFGLFLNPDSGNAFGILIVNSNAMEITATPDPGLQYRSIGGVLDMYVFTGPSPSEVLKQYWQIIGYPFMPPYWSLGFHLCRWGYYTLDRVRAVVDSMRSNQIPYDVQWNDIDYMDAYKIFTFDQTNFHGLGQFVNETLHHEYNMKYINIIDPGIHNDTSYPPYTDGLAKDVFLKNDDGSVYIGKVWPGSTAFPDFWKTETIQWWTDHAQQWHDIVPFDGYWIDMNEPASFVSYSICPENNTFESPPYVPANLQQSGDTLYLQDHTICMSTRQQYGHNNSNVTTEHYNIHSLYGHSELVATHQALSSIHDRPFIVSRSTFVTSGRYGSHWMGDNTASFEHLRQSISGMIMFNMFGIPMVGADICGFFGNTTIELCSRWMQLGAFYPFSRNHNTRNTIDQDPPSLGEPVISISRKYLKIRYSLLPFLYTLFYKAHTNGELVVNSLWMVWSNDSETYTNHEQFLWGEQLLFSPALYQGQTFVNAYFPRYTPTLTATEKWYAFETGEEVALSESSWVNISTPLNRTNIHIRGGSVLVLQDVQDGLTTVDARTKPYQILIALNESGGAFGDVFIDDGMSKDWNTKYDLVAFHVSKNTLTNTVEENMYDNSADNDGVINSITIYGIADMTNITEAMETWKPRVNEEEWTDFEVDEKLKVIKLSNLELRIDEMFVVSWKCAASRSDSGSSGSSTWIKRNAIWFSSVLCFTLIVVVAVSVMVWRRRKLMKSMTNYQNFHSTINENDI